MKKPLPQFTIRILKSKDQFFWHVTARNNKIVATTGERYKRKSHAVKMAVALFLQAHARTSCGSSIFGNWWNGPDNLRRLIDGTDDPSGGRQRRQQP